jgi:hypothetical protein
MLQAMVCNHGFTGCTSKIIQIGSQNVSNGQMVSVVDDTYIQDIRISHFV